MNRCIVITGTGKAGSKRILKIFDLSPQTHCRCEPNELPGSDFADLPPRQVLHPDTDQEMAVCWDKAVRNAARCMGGRDHLPSPAKYHYWPLAQRLQLWRMLKHRKLRRALSVVMPSLRGSEWPLPWWLGSRRTLDEAVTVLKTGPAAGWVPWLLQHRKQTKVVNIVRHPAGFLHSYIGRWLSTADIDRTTRHNRARLHTIAQLDADWPGPVDRIDDMSCIEAELWYWRYFYETVHAAGRQAPQYMLVLDEDIVADPVTSARRLYEFAELDWPDAAQTYLERTAHHWQSCTAVWKQLLDAEQVQLVERVLDGSPMQDWWTPDQRVSRFDYVAY